MGIINCSISKGWFSGQTAFECIVRFILNQDYSLFFQSLKILSQKDNFLLKYFIYDFVFKGIFVFRVRLYLNGKIKILEFSLSTASFLTNLFTIPNTGIFHSSIHSSKQGYTEYPVFRFCFRFVLIISGLPCPVFHLS